MALRNAHVEFFKNDEAGRSANSVKTACASPQNYVHIAGQLIDVSTGAHIWAERFYSGIEDIFDLQQMWFGLGLSNGTAMSRIGQGNSRNVRQNARSSCVGATQHPLLRRVGSSTKCTPLHANARLAASWVDFGGM
jgi:hypothetical protein